MSSSPRCSGCQAGSALRWLGAPLLSACRRHRLCMRAAAGVTATTDADPFLHDRSCGDIQACFWSAPLSVPVITSHDDGQALLPSTTARLSCGRLMLRRSADGAPLVRLSAGVTVGELAQYVTDHAVRLISLGF